MNHHKKKIACFMTNTNFRGGVISLYGTLKYMDRSVYDPIFVAGANGEHIKKIEELGVNCFVFQLSQQFLDIGRNQFWSDSFKNFLHFFSIIRIIFQMVRFMRKEGIDLIHTHDQKSSLIGGIVGFLSSVPVVWHVRDIPEGIVNVLDQFFGMLFARKIVAISATVARPLAKNPLLRKKISIIPNGVDLSTFNANVKGDSFCEEQKIASPIVGQISSLIPLKGIQYFIEAAHKLIAAQCKATFLVIGDNPVAQYRGYDDELKNKVKELGIEDKFKFLDFRDNIAPALAAFDVFVFPSTGDGFGKVLIEAAAMRIPVIACNTEATCEIIENNRTGLIVPPKNSQAIADAIDKLLKDEMWRSKMSQAGYQKVVEKYDLRKIVKKIEQIYQDILK